MAILRTLKWHMLTGDIDDVIKFLESIRDKRSERYENIQIEPETDKSGYNLEHFVVTGTKRRKQMVVA